MGGAEWEVKPGFPQSGDRTKGLILVKNWEKPGQDHPESLNNSGVCISYDFYFDTNWTEQPGAAGQGTSNPISAFFEHYIVEYGGHYYDPSYGVSSRGTEGDLKKNQKAWESEAISGIAIICIRRIPVAAGERASTLETKFETVSAQE